MPARQRAWAERCGILAAIRDNDSGAECHVAFARSDALYSEIRRTLPRQPRPVKPSPATRSSRGQLRGAPYVDVERRLRLIRVGMVVLPTRAGRHPPGTRAPRRVVR